MKTLNGLFARRILPAAAVLAALIVTVPVRANLLSSTSETQLETWLGAGDLNFINLFTKVAGDGQGSLAFHAAADGQDATFTLMEISGGYPGHSTMVLGGYNPDSWNSTTGFTLRLTEADRHAFIYNLTSGVKQHQNLNGQGWSGFNSSGDFEVNNSGSQGPTFGGGYDLTANSTLEFGTAYNFSYGGTSFATNILGDSGTNSTFNIARLEVYTFSVVPPPPTSVPESAGTLGLIVLSFAGLVTLRGWTACVTALRQA